MSKYATLLVENRNGLRILKFNTPQRKNAFRPESYAELQTAFEEASVDDTVRVVALTGVGDYYSSGNDIKAMAEIKGNTADSNFLNMKSKDLIYNFVKSFYKFPKPLIGVVNGPSIGISATTVALCDVIYASSTAYFYTPFTIMGLCAEGCSSYTFPKILGKSKAAEMLIFNHKLSANEALQFGFVANIFEPNKIEEQVWCKIEEFAKLPPASVNACKKLISNFEKEALEKANLLENEELIKRWESKEAFDAVMNFMEKSKKK